MQRSLGLLVALVLPFTSCSHSNDNGPRCAPEPTTSSWPSDPTALIPRSPRADVAFVPASHPPFPIVPRGPTVLSSLRLVTVIAAGDPLRDTLFTFSDTLARSTWLTETGREYGVAPGGLSIHLDGPALSGIVTTDDMRAYVKRAIDGAPPPSDETLDPHPDGRSIYMLFLPPGVIAKSSGEVNCNCNDAAGAHTVFDDEGDALAFSQRCTESNDDLMTRVESHEVIESLTDPVPGQGYVLPQGSPPWNGSVWAWLQDGDVELADLCTGTRITLDGWTYQRSWSNAAAGLGGDPCVPASSSPYFSTSASQNWFPIRDGESIVIPVKDWATGPRPDWYVYPLFVSSRGFKATITTATQQILSGTRFYSLNNGETAILTVTAPQAKSGTFDVVDIVSRAADRVDGAHVLPVGVYIP